MSEHEHLDAEALLDLLRLKSRAAKRIGEELHELKHRVYHLEREREKAQAEVSEVLREMEAKAAEEPTL